MTGVIGRSAGIRIDARVVGYEFINVMWLLLFLSVSGDCLGRYVLRLNEIIEVNKIVYFSIL